jgi:coenzyme F420-reducing hydrogenase gamma subunit
MSSRKPRLGVFKFASCDGCQLTVLDCEDELLDFADRVDIGYFLEAIRRPLEGEFDVALVEGSVYTPEQEESIRDIRRRSRFLITLGACAAHGGIQALRNFTQPDEYPRAVYALPQYVESLATSRPASDYVPVDLELQGCPISKQQLLRVLAQVLLGAKPHVPNHALCLDCKRQNIVCVLVAQGKPCMGPVTTTGCGVLCPTYDRPCSSCFGPAFQPNTAALVNWFGRLGFGADEIRRMFHGYYSQATDFKAAGAARAAAKGGPHARPNP